MGRGEQKTLYTADTRTVNTMAFFSTFFITRGSLITRGTRGTGDKSQIWQSLDRIANRDVKKKQKRKRNGTQTLTRATTSNEYSSFSECLKSKFNSILL